MTAFAFIGRAFGLSEGSAGGETLGGALGRAWRPTHRHRKGGLYRLVGQGVYEPDRSPVAIYDDRDGTIWIRPLDEFNDGRFDPV
ncbi:MAG: DUF1653 domain-containing protein [Pseudomonadota bacterium]